MLGLLKAFDAVNNVKKRLSLSQTRVLLKLVRTMILLCH